MKRTLSLVLILTVMLTLTGGISITGTVIAEERPTLQVICPSNVQDFPEGVTANDNFIVDYWSEQTGFDFDIVVLPSTDASQKLNLMFNSGEIYGMVFEKDMTALARFHGEGLLQPLDDYIADSKFFSEFEQYQTKGVLDGKQYGAVILPDGIPCASDLFLTRKDVLADVGITESPKTFEDFNEMLATLKAETGMIPLGVCKSPADASWGTISALFNVSAFHNSWCVRDGKVTFRQLQPEAYDYLVYAKSLYDDGMIPQDFLSLTEDALRQLYLSESIATMIEGGCWNMPTFMPMSEEKGFDTRFMDYPESYYGEKSYGNQDRLAASQIVFLSSAAKNPQDYITFLDFLIEPETLMVCNYGLEGEHYNLDADGNVEVTEAGDNIKWAVYYRNVFMPDDWYPVYGINAKWNEVYYPTERHSVGYTDFDPVEFMPQTSEAVALQKELFETIITLYYAKAVTGEVELSPESFEAMAAEWRAAGGQSLEEQYTEQYQALGSPDFSNMYVSFLPEEHPEYTGKYLWNGAEDLATQPTK